MYLNELMEYQMSLIIIHICIFLQNRLTNKIRSLLFHSDTYMLDRFEGTD
jgi:hypothetical protein